MPYSKGRPRPGEARAQRTQLPSCVPCVRLAPPPRPDNGDNPGKEATRHAR
jgi:hypothetical protein